MSALVEINFDGIIGPSHNYAGLSHGNIASSTNAGATAYPREAALQGIAKMRHNLELGLAHLMRRTANAISPSSTCKQCRTAAMNGPARWRSLNWPLPTQTISQFTRRCRPHSETKAPPIICGYAPPTMRPVSRFLSMAKAVVRFLLASISRLARQWRDYMA